CGGGRVRVDGAGGEGVGPGCGRLVPRVQVDKHVDLPAGQVDLVRVVTGRAALANPHAVHRDVDLVRIERGGGGTNRGEDPAPVRVVAEERALDQVVAGDRPGDL